MIDKTLSARRHRTTIAIALLFAVIAMTFCSRDDRYRIPSFVSRATLTAAVMGLLSGCGTLGSGTIVGSRTPVNEAVATTARQQTLMNIVRVYHNEAPLILDIVETDEMVSFGGSATGGVAGVGAVQGTSGGTLAGRTGSAGANLSAGDAVTNRYVPLQGQALINQLSNPITVETVNALYDSDWPLESILDLAYDRVTPSLDDSSLAIALLSHLDNDGAISLATAKSGFSKDDPLQKVLKTGSVTINTQSQNSAGGDTLNIYRSPKSQFHTDPDYDGSLAAWNLLARLYNGSQPNGSGKTLGYNDRPPSLIELRSSPRTHLDKIDLAQASDQYFGPVARTRTATGILKYLVTQPKVAFITLADYNTIRAESWNSSERLKRCGGADYYVLDPENLPQSQIEDPELYFDLTHEPSYMKYRETVHNFLLSLNPGRPKCPFDFFSSLKSLLINEQELGKFAIAVGELERNILVVRSASHIPDASPSWNDGTLYYSIMPDDLISQRNLMLVSQFLTIQSTSTPSPSLTTISPSGR